MKKLLILCSFFFLLLAAFLFGSWFNQFTGSRPTGDAAERRILHYVDPMDPSHISKEPGIAPCGMPMEPVYADDGETGMATSGADGAAMVPGSVRVGEQKQQLIGVQLEQVDTTSRTQSIRALGKITPNENRIYAIFAATDGWMSEVHDTTTGSLVRKDQLMAQIKVFDYDFFTWQQRYLTEMGNAGRRPVYLTYPGQAWLDGSGGTVGESPSPKAPAKTMKMVPDASSAKKPATGRSAGRQWGIPPGEMGYGDSAGDAGKNGSTEAPADSRQMMEQPTPSPEAKMDMTAPEMSMPGAAPHDHAAIAPAPSMGMKPSMGQAGKKMPPSLLKPIKEDDILYASKSRLELLDLGVGETQLDELARSGVYVTRIDMRSPVDGLVLARNVSPRQWIPRGTECFRIADMRKVWIEADIYESEAQYILPGMRAMVTMPGLGQYYAATVSEVPPRFDPATRTLKIRLEMDNPEIMFRPGMFVDVNFRLELPATKTVAASSVIDTGARKIVYVAQGEGIFEPREIRTGWSFGDRIEVIDGLKDGESVVVSGKFLIDSESRMQLAAMRLMAGSAATPAGEESPPAEQQPAAPGAGTAAPAPVPAPAMPPPAEIDPVCGMKVTDFDQARADGLLTEFQGKTYWFCSADCKEQFERNPQGFLDKVGMSGAQQPESHMHSSPQMQMSPPESQPATPAPPADQHGDHAASMPMPAPADAPPAEIDPVCGMKVTDFDQARADGLLTEYQGKTYWFCSADCKEQFERNPQGFLDKAGMSGAQQPEAHMHSSPQIQMSPPGSQPATPMSPADQHGDHAASMPMPMSAPADARSAETDPVCGMQVTDLDQARADGLMTEFQGKTYWFCSADCKEQFERNPQGFLDKAGQAAPPQGAIDHSGHGHD